MQARFALGACAFSAICGELDRTLKYLIHSLLLMRIFIIRLVTLMILASRA